MYRPLWSNKILEEVGIVLTTKLNRTAAQCERRINTMRVHFPEAIIIVPNDLAQALTCIPDVDDRHVVAAAICGHANAIITSNIRDFPDDCLQQYDLLPQTPDDFLLHQFHLNPELVLEKIDAQASAICQPAATIIRGLRRIVPQFSDLLQSRRP